MFDIWFALLLAFNSAMGCKIDVDNAVQFDLSPLKNERLAHSFKDSLTGTIFLATLCNSYPLLEPSCSIKDAVASESNKCIAYGRYDSVELTTYMNANEPRNGVMISYGNGGNVASSILKILKWCICILSMCIGCSSMSQFHIWERQCSVYY